MTGRTVAALAVLMALPALASEGGVRQSIIAHCRALVGDLGATMVKLCVDQDIAAYAALKGYEARHGPVIERCRKLMLSTGGWDLVRFCADQDIEAERALEGY